MKQVSSLLFFLLALTLIAGCEKEAAENQSKKEAEAAANKDRAAAAAENANATREAAESGESSEHASPPTVDPTAKLVHQPGAKLGERTMCPSMKGVFTVRKASPSVEHNGEKVYFCCAGCETQFAEDPDGMLTAVNAEIDQKNAENEAENAQAPE